MIGIIKSMNNLFHALVVVLYQIDYNVKYLALIIIVCFALMAKSQPILEHISRGLVAIEKADSVFLDWRLLGDEPYDLSFNVYEEVNGAAKLLNETPITNSTNLVVAKSKVHDDSKFYVVPVANGKELEKSKSVALWQHNYLDIPLQVPQYYRPGDASVGDLDGDGEYELVIHMTGRGADNSHAGITSEPILQAYEFDGTLLWTINLGKNIREGAHYTQFLVYDFDLDGKAEVVCKTADGTTDGEGNVYGNADSVYVVPAPERKDGEGWREYWRRMPNTAGKILRGPEYLSIFSGETGKNLSTVPYIPQRHPDTVYPTKEQMKEVWGDAHGNRGERYLAGVAYLDGVHPSLVMCRGYYTRTVLAAFDFKDGKLVHRWTFDSDDGTPGNMAYHGQGNHQLSVGDVDNDGKDEIVYGACTIDDDGTGLNSTGYGHGDALHLTDHDPEIPGLEIFDIQERFDDAGMHMRSAGSGEVLWKIASVKADESGSDKGEGPGRGAAFNIDPRYAGSECWVRGAEIHGLYNAKGQLISNRTPSSCNFAAWWDGDLLRELLDGNSISKWNWETERTDLLMKAEGFRSINGTKSTPVLSADLIGDWREEVILVSEDNKSVRLYTTTIPTNHKLYTLMHDPIYRLGIAWQNVAYNQPPHTSYYVGDDMLPVKQPNIQVLK